MRRPGGWIAAGAALLALAGCFGGPEPSPVPTAPVAHGPGVAVAAEPVPLDPGDPARAAIGDFRYAGGVALTSDQTARLHGLSDLAAFGGWATMVTDDGDQLYARLALDEAGRLIGLDDVELRPLRGPDGQPLQGKARGDAEGAARLINGDLLVSFERDHRIWRYPAAGDRRPVPAPRPRVAMADNDGMEGLAVERHDVEDRYWVGIETGSIWFCRLDAACEAVAGLPAPPPGFRLSALTVGPKGELVVLHHSYTPAVGSRIVVTIVRDPHGEKTVIGRLAMGPGSTTDNFEGVAVAARFDGDWRIYLLSDDNFSASQRTLLLAFDWTPPT